MKKYLQIALVLILVLLSCMTRAQHTIGIKNTAGFNIEMVKEHFLFRLQGSLNLIFMAESF